MYTYLLVVLLVLHPVPSGQAVKEFKTFEGCVKAVQSVEDEKVRNTLMCVAIEHNFI